MSSQFGAFIEIESSSPVANPAAVVRKDNKHGIPSSPSDHELDELQHQHYWAGAFSRDLPSTGLQTPIPPPSHDDIEGSAPDSPPTGEGRNTQTAAAGPAEIVPSLSNPPRNRWRLLSACTMYLANGMNDSAPGALIPYIEKTYGIGYAIVSLIFVANAAGYVLAAPFTHALESRFGRSRTYIFSQALMVTGFVIVVCKPPFPAVVVSFFLFGFGQALNLALNNVFCANLVNGTTILGIAHGAYGVGGTMGPLIATALASHGVRWSYFYTIILGLSVLNLVLAAWAFKGYEKEQPVQLLTALQRTASQQETTKKSNHLRKAIQNRVTLMGALYIFAYQGAEVSISGWVVSYLINYRKGDPSRVGYVSSGFWAGITVGRFVLSHPAHRIGEKRAVIVLVAGTIAFQLLAWFIPNIIGEAVAVAILGLLLGPVYPCATSVFTKLLPRNIQMSSLSFISAMGSSGGAAAPFLTGLLAQHVGIVALHPICLVLYGVMVVTWSCLPRIAKPSE
jgi:fucose permease